MRKRNNRIWVRLNDAEFSLLKHAIEDSGLTLESYLRQLISGYVPRSTPGPDYHAMIQALCQMSNQLEQIEQRLSRSEVFDPAEYQYQTTAVRELIIAIEKQTLLPISIKSKSNIMKSNV